MQSLDFNGNGSEYFKIWIVNILLTIITLGLYYPWAKVRNNRYFYANTTLDGRNFEYHANGKQLFFAYLIAMALLVTYLVLQNISPKLSLILFVMLFLLVPWLIYKSMVFNMKMTSFSNVRFRFDGNLTKAYINFFGYPIMAYILILVPMVIIGFLGIKLGGGMNFLIAIFIFISSLYAFGYIKKKNTEYYVDNTKYGQSLFKTDLNYKEFVKIAFQASLLAFLLMIVFGIIGSIIGASQIAEVTSTAKGIGENLPNKIEAVKAVLPMLAIIYVGMVLVMIIVSIYNKVKSREYIFKNTVLDNDVTFESTLKVVPYVWLIISNLILTIITIGFAYPWAKVRVAKMMSANTLVKAENGFDKYLSLKQSESSALGEEIGDAFDVDIGIGL